MSAPVFETCSSEGPSRPVRSRPSPTPPKAQPPSDELLEGKGWHFNRFGLLDPRAKAKEELVPEGNEELVPMDVSTGSASGRQRQRPRRACLRRLRACRLRVMERCAPLCPDARMGGVRGGSAHGYRVR